MESEIAFSLRKALVKAKLPASDAEQFVSSMEGHVAITIDQVLSKLDARFDKIDARFEQIDAKFEKFEEKIEVHFNEFETKLETKLDARDSNLKVYIHSLLVRTTLGTITAVGGILAILRYIPMPH